MSNSTVSRFNSAGVRITHLPTGIQSYCDSERAQHRNKAKALTCLKSKLFAIFGSTVPKVDDFRYDTWQVNEADIQQLDKRNETCTHTDTTGETN